MRDADNRQKAEFISRDNCIQYILNIEFSEENSNLDIGPQIYISQRDAYEKNLNQKMTKKY